MSQYIRFTEEEKLRAGSADIAEFLRGQGEERKGTCLDEG